MKIIGYQRADFVIDKQKITGCYVYIANDIDPRRGEGVMVDRCYISDSKAERQGINLAAIIGHDVRVFYNRYGKVDSILLAD